MGKAVQQRDRPQFGKFPPIKFENPVEFLQTEVYSTGKHLGQTSALYTVWSQRSSQVFRRTKSKCRGAQVAAILWITSLKLRFQPV